MNPSNKAHSFAGWEVVESTNYGIMYRIRAELKGPNGTTLPVCTIWMVEVAAKVTKFITMYPDRRRSRDEA